MKIVTVLQPWASLIVLVEKRLETRTWKTAHRGPLLIHAGRRFPSCVRDLCSMEPLRSLLRKHGIHAPSDLPLGKIVGVVSLDNCIPIEEVEPSEQERVLGDFEHARYAWLLSGAVRLETPIPFRGGLGVRDGPDTYGGTEQTPS